MGERSGYLQTGAISNSNRIKVGITFPSNEFPVRITKFTGTLYVSGPGNITVQLCDKDGNNVYTMATIASNGSLVMALGNNSPTYSASPVRCTGLAGKDLYIQVRGFTYASSNITSGYALYVETSDKFYTAVTAGNIIRASDFTQTGGSATAGSTKLSNSNFSSGTKAEASTFNSKVLQL